MWNFADIVEAIAAVQPDAPFHAHGARRVTWGEFEAQSEAIAQALDEFSVPRQSVVAVAMRNRPEYMIAYVAAWKAGLVPANISYRYSAREVKEILDDCRPRAVIFDSSCSASIEPWAVDHPETVFWAVDGSSTSQWAVDLPIAPPRHPRVPDRSRSGDDLVVLFTGGTTGQPKGVMWRQDDMAASALTPVGGAPALTNLEQLISQLVPRRSIVVPCPLMHATGLFGAYAAMVSGGTLVTLDRTRFDAGEIWSAVIEHGSSELYIVGDAFALPLVEALEVMADVSALRCLEWINSAGATWSGHLKARILKALPWVKLYDYFGSSEANGLGAQVSQAESSARSADVVPTTFHLGEEAALVSEDGTRLISSGSDEVGIVAASGRLPLGYLGDPDRTARLFCEIDGRRFLLSGDYARFSSDGTLVLLGRGSSIINTGGEKVFAQEVEDVLKRHAAVTDVVCVGVPDDRFGQTVGVVVSILPGSTTDRSELIEFARPHLASYKLPRHVEFVDQVPRTETGKPDYPRAVTFLASARANG